MVLGRGRTIGLVHPFLKQCAGIATRPEGDRSVSPGVRRRRKQGLPDFARDIAMQTIAARLDGVRLASEELGVGATAGARA
jgi:hypothetical protein